MIKAALYARVSTVDRQNPEMQLEAMRTEARRRGWDAIEYLDKISSSKERRPGLDQLWQDLRAGRIDVVLVWKFDRFARSVKELVNALGELDTRHVQFCSLTDGIDTATPIGKFMFHVIAAIAEFERDLIRERVRAGVAHARSQGKRLGRPLASPEPREVAELRAQGLSWRKVSRKTGFPVSACRNAYRRGVKNLVENGPQKG